MNGKTQIRYIGFGPTADSGRVLNFTIITPGRLRTQVSVEIAGCHFSGPARILVQEAAGICYLKLKELVDAEAISEAANHVSLDSADIVRYRQMAAANEPPAKKQNSHA